VIRQAKKLEGSIRNTGIHACGVIITPDDITNYVPVTTAKDSDLLVSQFDNRTTGIYPKFYCQKTRTGKDRL